MSKAFFAAPTRKLISELSVFAGKDAKNLSEEVKVAHRETHAKIARRLIQSLSCARQREPNAVCPTSVNTREHATALGTQLAFREFLTALCGL